MPKDPGPSTLVVRGSVEHEVTLSIDDLERLPAQQIEATRPGPRHVKWLQSIELRLLPE